MKFSVIMASRLIEYPSAAKDRENKLIRAVNSVMNQTFSDWELIVIADGCKRTVELLKGADDIVLLECEHRKLWAGTPRNTGILNAKGDWIVYLDNDDIYGENHLEKIYNGLLAYDWVWYNDIRYKPKDNMWYENQCDIHTIGRHGTSNVCHKRNLGLLWPEEGKYAHDYHFCQQLLNFKNGGKIATPEYYVCHVPGAVNSGGYDL